VSKSAESNKVFEITLIEWFELFTLTATNAEVMMGGARNVWARPLPVWAAILENASHSLVANVCGAIAKARNVCYAYSAAANAK
jgi:hypothetical protein